MEALLQMLVVQFPLVGLILALLGALVVIGQAVVVMTPSTDDDVAWEKIKAMPLIGALIAALVSFAPIQKK